MRWKTTKSQCFQDGCYMVQYVRPRIIFRERTETPNWTEKFLSTIAEWVSEQRKEINCYMVKVCKKAEKISFLFRGSNKCKNNIDISLKFSFDSMYPCTKPMRWKARGWGAGWGGERSHCHLVATLGNFYLLSFPFLFVIDHNNNQKQTALKLEKEKKCVWKKKKNPTLLTSVGSLCFMSIFHPILMTKWVLSNVCYQFDPKHTFIHFPLAPFFWSNRLYTQVKKGDAGATIQQLLETTNGLESHSSLLPIYAILLHKGIQCGKGNKDNSYLGCQIVLFNTRLTKYYLFRSRGDIEFPPG